VTQHITTPQARSILRRSLFWIGMLVVALIVVIITLTVTRTFSVADPLSASNPAPAGAQAIARVLADKGVTVTETGSLDDTLDEVTDAAATTILVYDPNMILTEEQYSSLEGAAGHIVLVDPEFLALNTLTPDVNAAGSVEGVLDADCTLAAAQRAGSVLADGYGYRVSGTGAATLCFGSGDDVYSVVQVGEPDALITVLGTTAALDNGHVSENGNAALALNLLGERENLVWYLPSSADFADGGTPTLGELSPEWLTPVVLLILLTGIAASVWRGRRMGALVIENLPVTVRASETMEGRARLYATASARQHALDSLRIGTVQRVGAVLGLPRVATVEEVIAAASAVLNADPRGIGMLLLAAEPGSDAELVRLSDELLIFERRVSDALRPHTA
jgi:hypothetical protein